MLKEYLTLDELKKMGWDEIRTLQDKRLRATLRYLLPISPFYKKFFDRNRVNPFHIEKAEDWRKYGLPLIRKKVYLENTRDFLVRPEGEREQIFSNYLKYAFYLDKAEASRLLFSGTIARLWERWHQKLTRHVRSFYLPKMPAYAVGTESGTSTPAILTSRQKIQNIFNLAEIVMSLLARHFNEDELIAGINLFPQNPPMTWQIINVAAGIRPEINLVNPSSGFTETRDLLKIAQASSPNLFSGTVDYLANIFLPLAQEQGIKFKGDVVYLNGFTKMHPIQRQRTKEMFKSLGVNRVVALDSYSASELKESSLIECEENSGFHHLAPLSNIIRTVRINKIDPESGYVHDWDFAREGEEGYAAVWNIDGAGTLLEGYLLGDRYEKIDYQRCPHCGLNVERIFNVTRAADQAAQIKNKEEGIIVDLNTLREKILNIQLVREVQLIVEKGTSSDRLIVRYIPADGAAEKAEKEIRELFETYSDVQPAAIEKASTSDFYRDKKSTFIGIVRT